MSSKLAHYMGRIFDKGILPVTPLKFRLGAEYCRYVYISGWEPEVRLIRSFVRPSEIAIDVGANIGLWTFAMAKSRLFRNIIAFEPNSLLTKHLKEARLPSVTICEKAVSDQVGKAMLRAPRFAGNVLYGWASLEKQIDVSTESFEHFEVDTICLDDLGYRGVGFIKIDVEGHELNVLNGGVEFFKREKPVCLLECRDRNRAQVEDFFSRLGVGYRMVNTKAEFGFELSAGNQMFSV